jgi:glycosyltransferase involved in cell wall biosynthesis
MIGWEYPPHISGGLGTACQGLTTALARLGVQIEFVVPRAWGDEDAAHMTLLGAEGPVGVWEPAGNAQDWRPEESPLAGDPDEGLKSEPVTAPHLDAPAGDPGVSSDGSTAPDASNAASSNAAEAQTEGEAPSASSSTDAPRAAGPQASAGAPGAAASSADEEDAGEGSATGTSAPLRTWRIPSHLRPYLSHAEFEALRAAFGDHDPANLDDEIGGEGRWNPEDFAPGAGSGSEPSQLRIERVAAALVEAGLPHVAPRPAPSAPSDRSAAGPPDTAAPAGAHYGDDLFGEVARYAAQVAEMAAGRHFDLIHAHDWMTWPAAIAVARQSGAPLVAHVHSLEHDRSGAHPDVRIDAVERAGLAAADRVICVSHYTAGIVREHYGVPGDLLRVVHNGVYPPAVVRKYRRSPGTKGPLVLFLGRVTFQKGPDYFVEAAARVARHIPDATFVVAGSGDMVPGLERRVADLGLEDRFVFPGFLRGEEVERMFSLADLYVMPSVSEPFGIAPLEAMSYNTPVIVSKQSGVSEVLSHALKVDFWDVERMADLMLGALRYPELRQEIVDMARDEVRRIHWDAAAEKCLHIYHETVAAAR